MAEISLALGLFQKPFLLEEFEHAIDCYFNDI
jgi:hypothetical protein